ncbi:MAG: class I SAM-dependent methyltransferase [Anaerolineales bacterium]
MIDHFGILAPFYERFIKPKPPRKLSEHIQMPPMGSMLDIGGGTGRIAQYFTGDESQIVVSDLSFKMVLQTKSKKGLQAVCSHSECMPFPEGHFDRIIMVDALHHVCDQEKTANELWRVIKPGGRIVIEEPNFHRWMVKLVAWGEKMALMRSHFLTPQEIKSLFDKKGASRSIVKEGHIAWVIIQKKGSGTV